MKPTSALYFCLLSTSHLFSQNGLIASYPFNGNANDASTGGHNGTVYGAVLTSDRHGIPNSAYYFDGVNDYIDLGSSFGYTSHSFSVWCKRSGPGGGNTLISKINNGPYDTKNSELGMNGFILGTGSTWETVYSTPSNPDYSCWNHVVATYNAVTNKTIIYFNGEPDSLNVSGYFDVSTTPIFIGARPWGPGYFFNGSIDDANIYNRVLSKHEIDSLYTPCTIPVSTSGNISVCLGGSATIAATGGATYLWSTGETTSSITVSPTSSTTYSVTGIANSCYCSGSSSASVDVGSVTPIINGSPLTICQGDNSTLNVTGGMSYLWSSGATATSIIVNPTALTSYSVTVTGSNGCSQSVSISVSVNTPPVTPTVSVNMVTLASSSSSDNQWYFNGNIITGATSQFYTVTQNGFYTVCVTDANSCSSCSAPLNFTTVGIDGYDFINSINVYPSVSNGIYNISSLGTGRLTIYNHLGIEVYRSTLSSVLEVIDIASQPAGFYILKITNPEMFSALWKIVKK